MRSLERIAECHSGVNHALDFVRYLDIGQNLGHVVAIDNSLCSVYIDSNALHV